MDILVTGATGTIGSAVARSLVAAGHHVRGLARDARGMEALERAGLRPVRGDLGDPEGLARLAEEVDAVVWAATTNDGVKDAAAVEAVVDALGGSGKALVYTSGAWVHGDTGGAELTEDAPLAPAALVAWRPAVERRVLSAAGVRGVVIRPGLVYGHGLGLPSMLAASARERGAARHVGDGRNRWPVVHLDDLAELYRLAVERAPGGTALLAVAESVPLVDIARAASLGAGAGGRTEPWPLVEARRELGHLADALALDQRLSSRRAEELLGWRPRAPGVLDDLGRAAA